MYTIVTKQWFSNGYRHWLFICCASRVVAATDEARDEDGVEERLGSVVVNERDGERVARFSALIPLSVLIFFGEAKRLPMSNDGTLEGSPWRKCRLQIRECSPISASVRFKASSHFCLFSLSAGNRNIDTFLSPLPLVRPQQTQELGMLRLYIMR